jgi:hypothetical protein
VVAHDAEDYVVTMRLVGVLAARNHGPPVGSIAQYCDDVTCALDWLFFGI